MAIQVVHAEVIGPVRAEWADAIWREWRKGAEAILRTAHMLIEAKEHPNKKLPHGEFEAMIEKDLPFGPRTARRLMAIGRDEKGRLRTHGSDLPPSWRTLYEITKMPDEVYEQLPDGFINPGLQRPDLTHFVASAKRQLKHQDIADVAAQTAVTDPGHRFSLIYADPPWQFHTYSEKGKDLASPDNHYPTMPLDEIKTFKCWDRSMLDVAAKDCILFLWCTPANLLWGLEVMDAWGFEYKTHMVWVKDRSGTGYYALQQHEPLLIGTRGSPAMPTTKPSSVIHAPRGEHSAKPQEFRDMLKAAYPLWDEKEMLEVFARDVFDGWSVYGNQAVASEAIAS